MLKNLLKRNPFSLREVPEEDEEDDPSYIQAYLNMEKDEEDEEDEGQDNPTLVLACLDTEDKEREKMKRITSRTIPFLFKLIWVRSKWIADWWLRLNSNLGRLSLVQAVETYHFCGAL